MSHDDERSAVPRKTLDSSDGLHCYMLWANSSSHSVQINVDDYVSRRDSVGYQVYPGTEREDFDFAAERHPAHATNLIESTAHLIKGCLGAGVLSIHVGFMYAGIWTAVFTTALLGILVVYTMTMLIKSAHRMYNRLRISRLTYPDLAEVAVATAPWTRIRKYSKSFRYLVDTFLLAAMCGSCCIYEIMIAETLKKFFESSSSTIQEFDLNLRYYVLIVAGPLTILCLIKNMKYMAPFSLVADIVMGLCVMATMYYSLSGIGKVKERPSWKSVHGFVKFCGVSLFSMDGMAVIMPVENNMKSPKYFFVVLQFGMTTTVVLVTCAGFFGYWGWGENCKSPVTIHMPDATIPYILQFLIIIMLSVTFAVHFWVPFGVVWHYLGRRHKSKRAYWEKFYRVAHILLITAVAIASPDLIRLMVFVGNFFLAFIVFIFPALIESLVFWHSGCWMIMKNGIIVLIGLFFVWGAFYSSIDDTL